MTENDTSTKPIVFYDGGCPLCCREIEHYQRLDSEQRIHWVDIQQSPDELQAYGLTWEQAMRRMHVRDCKGVMVTGVDAFAAIWQQLSRYRILARLVSLPGARWVSDQAYTLFARRRFQSRCNNEVCMKS